MRRTKLPFGLYKQDRSPFWWCRIRGVRQSTGKEDYNEAVHEAAKRDREGGAGDSKHRPQNKAKASLAGAVERFLEAKRAAGRAEGTFDMYGKKIRHLGRLLGDTTDVNDITSEKVDKFINTRRDEGAKPNTIHKELTTLRGILRQAKRDKTFRHDLGEVMPIAFDPEYTPRTRFLSPAALDRVLAELPPNHAAAAAFIVAAACRLADMVRAEPSDLTAVPGFIRVRASKTKKNREGFRLVPVTALNSKLLAQVKAATRDRTRRLFETWSNVVRDLGTACDRASACKECRAALLHRRSETCSGCSKLEVIDHVTPNDLRRTHAKWLRGHGVEYGLIGDVLGHVDARMAKKVYGQTEPEMLSALLKDRIAASASARAATPSRRRRAS
jgi:integrase